MRVHFPVVAFLTCVALSSMTYAATEPLGQWPAKPVSVKPKQFSTIFGPAPIGHYKNTPEMDKALQEKEQRSVMPKNVARIPQFGWRLAPELLRAEDVDQLKLSRYDQEAVKARLSNADQILQNALIPALKDQRYLVYEADHLDARFQLAELARNMNKQMLAARQKSWTREEADKVYSVLNYAFNQGSAKLVGSHAFTSQLVCSQLLSDMADYIYNPTALRFEQYVTLINQRYFCGSFPSQKMDGSLKQAYSNDQLQQLYSASKYSQARILEAVSQKVFEDISGFAPPQATQAASKKAPAAAPATTPATTPVAMSAASKADMSIKDKGLNGELPQAPFKFTFDEMDQVGFYLESIVGTGKGDNLKFADSAGQLCMVLHPELRAKYMNPNMVTGMQRNGVQGVMGNLMRCSSNLKKHNVAGADKLQAFVDQYTTAMKNR